MCESSLASLPKHTASAERHHDFVGFRLSSHVRHAVRPHIKGAHQSTALKTLHATLEDSRHRDVCHRFVNSSPFLTMSRHATRGAQSRFKSQGPKESVIERLTSCALISCLISNIQLRCVCVGGGGGAFAHGDRSELARVSTAILQRLNKI